jgi:hypothetical protein
VAQAKDCTHEKGAGACAYGGPEGQEPEQIEDAQSEGEHALRVIKQLFGFTKTRDDRLVKNATRLVVACVLTNLSMASSLPISPVSGHRRCVPL